MKFVKYQGLGNDFIIIEKRIPIKDIARICDRRFGIGADGVIVHTMKNGLPFMEFYNSDGSIAKMCGNGIRCYADYLSKRNIDFSKIDTLAGIKNITKVDNLYCVDMGSVNVKFLDEKFKSYNLNFIDSGTDHVVILSDEKDLDEITRVSKEIELNKKLFPLGTNVNFVEIINDRTISVITHERGAGLTYACGTGAVASAYYCYLKNLCINEILVILKGGLLNIRIEEDRVFMTGQAQEVFTGEYAYEI